MPAEREATLYRQHFQIASIGNKALKRQKFADVLRDKRVQGLQKRANARRKGGEV